jgi:epoxyqueuosine reductase
VADDPKKLVKERARALGFDAVGVARADEPLEQDHERYRAFVRDGLHGEMGYLADDIEVRRRLDTADILEGAKSVICVAVRYARKPSDEANDPPVAKAIARYARGRDYHNGLRKKLRKLAAFVRALGSEARPVHARPMCDTAPVLERAWAARAGLGFVGKNGLLIVPGEGSLLLLGEVVTTLALEPDVPMTERCGSCTRCLDACPTQAFVRPFVLDPRRCVSYLTIEHRSAIDPALREGVGAHLFGCDDCQTVCPFNASTRASAKGASARFAPHPSWSDASIEALLDLDEEGWRRLVEGSPVHRATRDGIVRNALIVLGNAGESEEPVKRVAERSEPPVVAEAAAWALEKLRKRRKTA